MYANPILYVVKLKHTIMVAEMNLLAPGTMALSELNFKIRARHNPNTSLNEC